MPVPHRMQRVEATFMSSADDARSPAVAARVLLVEDDEAIRELVEFHLKLGGFEVTTVGDGADALQISQGREFDLIILDILLPKVDGITLCESIRRSGANQEVPILMLTARQEESDKIIGLKAGADDYVTKPFGIQELVARIHALLRRPRSTWRRTFVAHEQPTIRLLGITIDPSRRRVVCDNRPVSLTPQEFSLLYVLMSHPGIVFSREELLSQVWRNEVFVTSRGVDTLVKRLRRKIERHPAHPVRVITVWGAGYKFGEF